MYKMDNNENTVTDLSTGNVIPFTYLGEEAEQLDLFEVDDTVNIPRGEYEELIEDSVFLFFLEQTVGPEVWDQALKLFDEHIAKMEDDDEGVGG